MKIFPKSGSEWLALLLLPFKVFVPAGYLSLAVLEHIVSYRHYDSGALGTVVLLGYMVSFCILVLGGVIQRSVAPRRDYFSTCGFILALFIFVWLTLPYLAHT